MTKKKVIPKKILIVEDDSMLLEIYQKKFSKDGYNVSIAKNGTEAEKQTRKIKPDLVLLDLLLPEEDGFEVLKRIKKNPETKDIKVIVFSNLSQEEDKEEARRLGAQGFITKSNYTPQEIINQIKEFFKNVNKKPEEGTRVIVDLSTSALDAKKVKIKKSEKKKKSHRKGKRNGRRILIVEDEEVFAEVFGKKLDEVGFEVDIARNGAWGLRKLEEEKYDILIVDIMMPAVDGFELIKKIKNIKLNKAVPIIVFSNSVDEKDEQEILKTGVSEFLIKTRITPSELAKKVNKVLKKVS